MRYMVRQARHYSRGFTFIELIISLMILATLTAIAIPSFMATGDDAKGTKSLNNINDMGTALLMAYRDVAGMGDVTATGTPDSNGAIATFNENLGPGAISDSDNVIIFGNGTQAIQWIDIYPVGLPFSPFDPTKKYEYAINPIEGKAVWKKEGNSIQLHISRLPSISIRDPVHKNIVSTFTP